ncbi:MAG: DUF1566 domain-containing protein [Stagnimonas sp.]|nr:DUF1566 domain-containing protein [Stagnimonas sp.]
MKSLARFALAAGAVCLLSGFSLFSTEKDDAAQCVIVSRYMNYGEQSKLLDRAASKRLSELIGQECDASDPRHCLRLSQQAIEGASLRAFPDGDSSNLSTVKDWAKAGYCENLMSSYRDSLAPQAGAGASTPAPDSPAAMADQGGNVLLQKKSGLQWMRVQYGKNLSWDAASAFCSKSDFAGGRWRLPKTAELQSIVDPKISGIRCGVAYTCKVSPLFVLPNRLAWSASKSGPFSAELVSLDDGSIKVISMAGSVDEPIGELCVRSTGSDSQLPASASSSAPIWAITDLGGGVLLQPRTRLKWTKSDAGGNLGWEEAKAYCKALTADGGGWQLPHEKILKSLINERAGRAKCGGSDVCIVSSLFDLSTSWFWSSDLHDAGPMGSTNSYEKGRVNIVGLVYGNTLSMSPSGGSFYRPIGTLCVKPPSGQPKAELPQRSE